MTIDSEHQVEASGRVIAEYINTEIIGANGRDVGLDDELLLDGHIDSLGIVRLVSFLEERFEKPVPPDQVTIENFRTVATIARYVENLPG